MENEDKEAWCRLGEEYERLFLKKQSLMTRNIGIVNTKFFLN